MKISHADRYFAFQPGNVEPLGTTLSDVIVQAVRKAGTIESLADGRMEKAP